MPEKPEVVTVVKNLIPELVHKKITGCNVYWDNIIAYPDVDSFKVNIIGQVIRSIVTRGKFIVIELDDYSLLIHLRMEGKFFFRKAGEVINKHEHVELILDYHISFRFHDVRKFGKMYLIKKEDTYGVPPLSLLGLEYYDDALTPDYLIFKFKNKKLPIKTVLLDQSIITGIGNIYDDEVLFLSGISPFRRACDLSRGDCSKIIDNTRKVLDSAIELGGTTIKSFTSSEGVHGLFQNKLLVHGKGGSKCPNCQSTLLKTKVNGRGTHYCEKCQK